MTLIKFPREDVNQDICRSIKTSLCFNMDIRTSIMALVFQNLTLKETSWHREGWWTTLSSVSCCLELQFLEPLLHTLQEFTKGLAIMAWLLSLCSQIFTTPLSLVWIWSYKLLYDIVGLAKRCCRKLRIGNVVFSPGLTAANRYIKIYSNLWKEASGQGSCLGLLKISILGSLLHGSGST